LPDGLPPRRAVLAANMETALNAVWDGGAGPGDRVAVIGAGAVGCLTASILSRLPSTNVVICDTNDARSWIGDHFGVSFVSPDDLPQDFDLIFHTSASGAGLSLALDRLGFEGRLVEMSWYGAGDTAAALGGGFHSRRLSIISSQVGSVSPSRRPRWTHRRRLETALQLLADDPRLDALITHEVAFEEAPDHLPMLLRDDPTVLTAAIRYD
jgi:threonine dehydrogenase-like Zn-dependent dehydrogenase